MWVFNVLVGGKEKKVKSGGHILPHPTTPVPTALFLKYAKIKVFGIPIAKQYLVLHVNV